MELKRYEMKENIWSERLYFECINKHVLERFLSRYEEIVNKSFSRESMRKFILDKGNLYVEDVLMFELDEVYETPIDYVPEESKIEFIVRSGNSSISMMANGCFESDSVGETFLVEFIGQYEWDEIVHRVERIIVNELDNFLNSLIEEYYSCREGFSEKFDAFEALSKKKSLKDLTVDMF